MPYHQKQDMEKDEKEELAEEIIGDGKHPKRKLREFRVEFADNGGFIVSCEYEQPKSKGNAPSPAYEPTKRKVFSNKRQLKEFIDELL
jgi:hypothetical protein